MTRYALTDKYFEWLCELVSNDESFSYSKLLRHLHNTEFRYLNPKDRNRAVDGEDLRWRFRRCDLRLGPCSVLEMMVALAIRMEETIMDDPIIGDRTSQWFWGMIVNLGLGSMTDVRYDSDRVDEVIETFLEGEYERDGRGGLFRIRNYHGDVRSLGIWTQLCYYLDTIT